MVTLILIIVFVFFIAIAFGYKLPSQKSELRPYKSKNPLTPTETTFYHRLIEALPDYIVLAQVQLSGFLEVDKTKIVGKQSNQWFGSISQQSIDYLICTKDFSIVTAIELDDKTHLKKKSIERDDKKNKNLAAAKVPLIRWHAEAMPELETIRQSILKYDQGAEDHTVKSTEWLDQDEKEYFFNRSKRQTPSFPMPIVIGAFVAAFMIAFLTNTNNVISSIFKAPAIQQTNAQPSIISQPFINPLPQNQPNNALQEVMAKQQQESMAREDAKRQAQIAQKQLLQQQEEAKVAKINEADLKEEAWIRFYKSPVDCTTESNVVKCGNDYIRNRRIFEQNWAAQKAKQGQLSP